MAGRRLHHSGMRARTAKQKTALRKAQLVSAQKRKRNKRIKRVAIGLTGGIAVAGIGLAGTTAYQRGYPHSGVVKPHLAAWATEVENRAKAASREQARLQKKLNMLRNRQELVNRNKARRHTPEQRADARAKRKAYLDAYNERRKADYWKTQSVSGGARLRKVRAKETRPRKRKTD